jgi:hypothetical protein
MSRDTREAWPEDAPIGTFDITGQPNQPRLHFVCPNRQRCTVLLAPNAGAHAWQWDGNEDAPTLSPSVNCGGCGWHGHIQGGVIR